MSLNRDKRYRVAVTNRFEKDVEAAYQYIKEHGSVALALSWVRRLSREVESLDSMPGRFPQAYEAEKLEVDIRQMIFGKRTGTYRVIYRIDENQLEVHILTLRHTSQDEFELKDIE